MSSTAATRVARIQPPPTTAAPSMAKASRPRLTVGHVAAIFNRLIAARARVAGMAEDVAMLGRTRLTAVVGEEALLSTLRSELEQADAHVARVAATDGANAHTAVAEIEKILADPLWSLAEEVAADLARRRVEIEAQTRLIHEEYSTLRLNFDRLMSLITRADQARFESAEARALAVDVTGKFRASDPDLRAGRYDTLAVAVKHARGLLLGHGLATRDPQTQSIVVDATKFDAYVRDLAEQIGAAETRENKLARRSELFVISGGAVNRSVPYKVLLRRPGYGAIQETNLYDDVEVLETDQALFRETIDRIADTALVGIRSAAGIDDPELRRARPARETSAEHLDQLDVTARLEKIGRRMYSLLIPDAMQRLIDETDDFPLTITSNNPELPWELLHDGEEFLCLKRMFARMPAGQTFPRRSRDTPPLGETRPPRVLLIHSESGEALPSAKHEIDTIAEKLAAMSPTPVVTLLTGNDVSSSRLTDELSLGNYDVIHYAGHAGFDAERPHLSYLLLTSGEQFRAERVQRLLEGHPVVFLNACESTRAAPQKTGKPTGSTVAQAQGLGSAFVYGGAQACVGSLWPVFDDTAADLAVHFYEHLVARRQRVGEALRRAREHSRASVTDKITWAAYALYGDPAYHLGAPTVTTWGPTT